MPVFIQGGCFTFRNLKGKTKKTKIIFEQYLTDKTLVIKYLDSYYTRAALNRQ